MSRPKYSMQLCWSCRNAVPTEDGACGCEWSREFRPVPGWTAEALEKPGFGLTWRITECPKYMMDPPREGVPY